MAKTMEQYMSKTCSEYGSGIARPRIDANAQFELKGQFLKELRDNTFNGSEHEDANEHIKKVLEIIDLFHIPNITQNQPMLRAFPVSLTGAASRWLRNEPFGSITTWEVLKMKKSSCFIMGSMFQQDKSLTQKVLSRLKLLLMLKWPSKKWLNTYIMVHIGISSRNRSTKTSDGLAAIQAKLNNLGREIKKVNEKVYAAQVGCEQCKGPHYTRDCPLKEEGKTLEEAYYTQFGAPYQPVGQYRAAGPGFYQRNNGNSSYPARRDTMEASLSKFMAESAKRHEENSKSSKRSELLPMQQ
ncbi:hypothetical protein Tco_0490534 [Tanacetum coccineum]